MNRRVWRPDKQPRQPAADNRTSAKEEVIMMGNLRNMLFGTAMLAATSVASGTAAAKDLTLCWAAWDPANALVELSKDFTTKTGIAMKFEFVPWTSFADRFINELNSKGKLCDLLIGDSQWIGGGAPYGAH